jgi:hypothetical protein
VKRLFALATTVIILGCLLRAVDWADVRGHLARLHLGWLAAALALFTVQIVVAAARWRRLADDYVITLGESVGHVLASSALNLALPSKLGDLSKAGFLVRRATRSDGRGKAPRPGGRGKAPRAPDDTNTVSDSGASPLSAAGLVVVEKLLDVAALGALLLIGIGLSTAHRVVYLSAVALFFGVAILFLRRSHMPHLIALPLAASVSERQDRRDKPAGSLWRLVVTRRAGRTTSCWAMLASLSLVLWCLHLLQIALFFFAAGISVTPIDVLSRVPLAIFAGLLPITVAGIGTRDSALVVLFLDTASPAAVAVVGMLTALRYLIPGVAGLPVLAVYLSRDRRPHAAPIPAPHITLRSRTRSETRV